jgi:hypothetical protein
MRDGIQAYSIPDLSKEATLIVTAILWFQRIRRDASKFDTQRFNPKTLNEMEVRVEYKLYISNQFTAFDNVDDCREIHRVWKNIGQNIKICGKSP